MVLNILISFVDDRDLNGTWLLMVFIDDAERLDKLFAYFFMVGR